VHRPHRHPGQQLTTGSAVGHQSSEDLINKESISVPLVFALQTPGVLETKLVAPQTDRFMTYRDATLSQKILNI
jgi:hypothetical protein